MTITTERLALSKLKCVLLSGTDLIASWKHDSYAMTFNHELMSLGYIMSNELFHKIAGMDSDRIAEVAENTLAILREFKGADVKEAPMYPGFPKQVMEMSSFNLFMDQITHYWTAGTWKPTFKEVVRPFGLEEVEYQELGFCTRTDVISIFTCLLKSNDSIKDGDKKTLEYFMTEFKDDELVYPDTIPYKENVCIVAGMFLDQGRNIDGLIKTSTDVLRVVTYLSGGDITLSENSEFMSLPRSYRRKLVKALENVIKEEDIKRHKNKWVALAHSLHVGDYSKKVWDILRKPRNRQPMFSVEQEISKLLKYHNLKGALALFVKRPGHFARNLDMLLRDYPGQTAMIMKSFISIMDKVSTRVILQAHGHFQNRAQGKYERVVIPKGSVAKALKLPEAKPISNKAIRDLLGVLEQALLNRFAEQKKIEGNVFLDPALKKCPLPAQLRNASPDVNTVARGTRLPLGSKNTLRFFIYWVGRDIDLSATLHGEDFGMIDRIAYTHRRSDKFGACHSGDITYAPDGAHEFIDIPMDRALSAGARYVVMNVLVFSGPNFSDHEKCFAGWMTRKKPNHNAIFDPKTVQHKFDLVAQSRNEVAVVFDLKEREAIWCDLTTPQSTRWGGNNVESNRASIEQVLRSIVLQKKFNLYDLFAIHAQANNAKLYTRYPTEDEEQIEFDHIFSIHDGITPSDVELINAEFIE